MAAKKNNLVHVEVKDYVSPALQKPDEGGGAPATGNNMMAMIMAKRNQMKKGGAGAGATAPPKPAPRQSNPMVQPPKPVAPPPKPAPRQSQPLVKPPVKQAQPPKASGKPAAAQAPVKVNVGKGKGIPPPPPPPPPPPSVPTVKTTSKPAASKPVDLAAELAAKKKNLAHVEVKEYV